MTMESHEEAKCMAAVTKIKVMPDRAVTPRHSGDSILIYPLIRFSSWLSLPRFPAGQVFMAGEERRISSERTFCVCLRVREG